MPRRDQRPGTNAKSLPEARQAALEALTACLRGQDVQPALDLSLSRAIAGSPLDPRDAALATELVYGTLRYKIQLDYILSTLLKDPAGLPGPMRLALAVAAYEILHLDKVPAYASADWATEYVKSVISPRLAKVCNAVLRRVADLAHQGVGPSFYREGATSEAMFLARLYSAPQWLTDLWLDAYGPDRTRGYLAAGTKAAPLGLRFRPAAPGAMDRHAQLAASPHCLGATTTGVALASAPDDLFQLLDSGMAVRQSLAGQQALEAVGAATWVRPVWDACCGRGGKSMLLADSAPGMVLASDPNARRLRGLAGECRRLGATNIAPFRAKADQFTPLAPLPSVLLDAPCSGLGVLSRRPDTKFRRTLADVSDLTLVQARILDHAASCVAPGGVLAYVTCTLSPAENERQIEAFLDTHPDFTPGATFTTPHDSPLNEFFHAVRLDRR